MRQHDKESECRAILEICSDSGHKHAQFFRELLTVKDVEIMSKFLERETPACLSQAPYCEKPKSLFSRVYEFALKKSALK